MTTPEPLETTTPETTEPAPETTETTLPEETEEPEVMYTDDELFCMAAVIYNEAGGNKCSDEHRALVGYVVLNRVNDPRFPDSIREVLEQRGQYAYMSKGVRFAKRHTNPGEKRAVERAYRIAREVLENRNNIPIPANVVFQAEFKQGIGVYKHLGNTYFCYAKEIG